MDWLLLFLSLSPGWVSVSVTEVAAVPRLRWLLTLGLNWFSLFSSCPLWAVFGGDGPLENCDSGITHSYSVSLISFVLLHPGCQHPITLPAEDGWNTVSLSIGSPYILKWEPSPLIGPGIQEHSPISHSLPPFSLFCYLTGNWGGHG